MDTSRKAARLTIQTAGGRPENVETMDQLDEATRHAGELRYSAGDYTANVGWAGRTLVEYAKTVGREMENPPQAVLSDLFADLMHLADALDLDVDQAWDTAHGYYAADRADR